MTTESSSDSADAISRRVGVLIFGPQAELAGKRCIDVDICPGQTTAAEVLQQLGEACEDLQASLPLSRLAVNHAFCNAEQPLKGDEELALIGMVGGG
ncbi:MAG: MoaD/ThiS family protein [Planctomycetota bacterium]